ncbi:MAG: beta-lactamase family protein [Spirochaetales bacterium]|nr:beta-lactamase family protein [Spirochaetales bacterium]
MVHQATTDCTPEQAAYNPDVLERIDKYFLNCIDKGITQGAIYMMSRGGKVFAHRSMGKLRPDTLPGTLLPDAIRPAASITKVFTATAILQLIEQGKCFLWNPAALFIPELDNPMHHHILIQHLLTHTSGLSGDAGNYFEPFPIFDWLSWTKENWIRKALAGPLAAKPGTQWRYSSSGFSILAEIIARISKMDYDDYVTEKILKPLKMDSSFFYCPEHLKDKFCIVGSDMNQWAVNKSKANSPSPSVLGGGGLSTNVKDLHQLGLMMLSKGTLNNKRILGRKTVEAATRAQIKNIISYCWQPHIYDDSYPVDYGLGWELQKNSFMSPGTFGHEGAEGAALHIDPREEFVFTAFYPDKNYHRETWVHTLPMVWSGLK